MVPPIGSAPPNVLLETVPGIASVLRSPVADSLVRILRAAAGTGEFRVEDAHELLQFAVRRGLIGNDEGERLSNELLSVPAPSRGKPASKAEKPRHRSAAKPIKRPAAKKLRPKKKR
jgi:hypothetical protein